VSELWTLGGIARADSQIMHAGKKLKIALWIAIGLIVICLALPLIGSRSSPVPMLIGLFALTVAVGIPIFLGRRRASFMALWLAVYVVVYSVLSWRGGYIGGNFGGSDNRDVWYPAYCGEAHRSPAGRQHCSLRPFAWFFLPLVILDRTTIHRTHFDVD